MIASIKCVEGMDAELQAVPSKAETLRALTCAALADGTSVIRKPLLAEDQFHVIRALKELGAAVAMEADGLHVKGCRGRFKAPGKPLFLGNSGVGMRFLSALACLAVGSVKLEGNKEMRQRPIGELVKALNALGVKAEAKTGCPPVEVKAGRPRGGRIELDCGKSSQFLSALLLLAPFAKEDVRLAPIGKVSSKPFVELTIDFMERFGVRVEREGEELVVKAGQRFKAAEVTMGGDFAGMSCFLAAPLIAGGKVVVHGLDANSKQPDRFLLHVLEKMGGRVHCNGFGVKVEGDGRVNAIEENFNGCPDIVPTVAVLCAFARGKSRLCGIGHLRFKESDRVNAILRELKRLGISARRLGDCIDIEGGEPCKGMVQAYKDHRIAMAFSLVGLRVPGVKVNDAGCVHKSFPLFFEELAKLGERK